MDLNDPRLVKYFFIGICVIGLLYLYLGTAFLPFSFKAQAKELKDLEGRYETLSLEVNRARQSAKHLPHLEAEYEALQTKWEEANQLLPSEKQIASLLREICFRGQSCGVEFVLFQPLAPVAGSFYTEHPVDIKVEGGYHQIAAFLNELGAMTRIVNIRNLLIEHVRTGQGSEHAAQAHFLGVAYTLGVIAPPAGGGEGSQVTGGKRLVKKVAGSGTRGAGASQGGQSE